MPKSSMNFGYILKPFSIAYSSKKDLHGRKNTSSGKINSINNMIT